MELNTAFGLALKQLRKHRKLTQEDFTAVSSRTYLSTLERGQKGPTIQKLEQLAGVLGVHPATLLIAAYLAKDPHRDSQELIARLSDELQALGLTDQY
ncbi:helix-turn-helix domain-containing protein [Stutzerimonas stutzeri]|uniref:XRE family transcriptional regulator n=2 Tax=Pseudomonadaceae TaxID=135621 RepID=A0A427H817_ECTOL|nr:MULTISPECIES: helix-turn-helix transcriptional regulator [Pseudomonadaceae]WAD25771.1 helix-turn-helix transcriptional regulator [Pseudomonadaceae bacterium T75]EMB2825415.1 helix-turn-helix transcriptional regulator [Pseudomonas aeruginosa]MBV5857933.1 helix-turn-helix domain-containing protein [Pseudomonas aeruginosa]MCS9083731.1 helix-turn-helix domain-containing protein [Pseudomonas aeruginosa]MCT0698237.1 helix-turn-helix domain-containing protein [Pseudomonas aeruginosa]